MRIRKRQPVVLEGNSPRQTTPRPAESRLLEGAEADRSVGQNSCSCCSRQRQLQDWEVEGEVAQEKNEPSNVLGGGRSVTGDNQGFLSEGKISDDNEARLPNQDKLGLQFKDRTEDARRSEIVEGEEKDANVSSARERLGAFERIRGNEKKFKASSGDRARVYAGEQLVPCSDYQPCSVGDINHPGNKPKESLLYSLYCVFSKLSGKPVLTAREALSRIIEHRLPGLDEETGLPSVHVAKVMRSNPYFVHFEGGKFFLCSSGPSTDGNVKDEADSGNVMDSGNNSPRQTSPSLQPKIVPLKGFSKTEDVIVGQERPRSMTGKGAVTKKRARTKGASVIDDGNSCQQLKRRSRKLKAGGRAYKSGQNSVSHDGQDHGAEMNGEPVPICKRYDGRGWKCKEKALEGYSMCRHHHELIVNRLARLRSSGRLGSKKPVKRRRAGGKPVKEIPAENNEGDATPSGEQYGAHCWKNVKARSLKSLNN